MHAPLHAYQQAARLVEAHDAERHLEAEGPRIGQELQLRGMREDGFAHEAAPGLQLRLALRIGPGPRGLRAAAARTGLRLGAVLGHRRLGALGQCTGLGQGAQAAARCPRTKASSKIE